MARLITILLLAALSGCGAVNEPIMIDPGDRIDRSLRSVNGAIHIGEAAHVAGKLSNVNGRITIDPAAQVGEISSVNGRIELMAEVEAERIESVNGGIVLGSATVVQGEVVAVNGSIEIGPSARIETDVSTVNGRIEIGPAARINGKVANVRGKITLDGASVEQIETSAGSIELTNAAEVRGRLWVKEAKAGDTHVPEIVIGPGVKVAGPLQFDREVELLVHDSAEVGEIIGAEAKCFSCEIADL